MENNQFVSQFPLPPVKYYKPFHARDPPPPPKKGETYAMFGVVYATEDKQPSLEESGRKVLYNPAKRRTLELKKLNKQLLTTFVELVQCLCSNPDPESYKAKVADVETIIINMHHLLYTLREDQAHQNIKRLLDKQTKLRNAAADTLDDALRRSDRVVASAAQMLEQMSGSDNSSQALGERAHAVLAGGGRPPTTDQNGMTADIDMDAKAGYNAAADEGLIKEDLERIVNESM